MLRQSAEHFDLPMPTRESAAAVLNEPVTVIEPVVIADPEPKVSEPEPPDDDLLQQAIAEVCGSRSLVEAGPILELWRKRLSPHDYAEVAAAFNSQFVKETQ